MRQGVEEGNGACARVQRFSVGCEGGTSITRYMGQRGRGGIVEGGVRARVVERQIVRHLTHLIPYLTPSP